MPLKKYIESHKTCRDNILMAGNYFRSIFKEIRTLQTFKISNNITFYFKNAYPVSQNVDHFDKKTPRNKNSWKELYFLLCIPFGIKFMKNTALCEEEKPSDSSTILESIQKPFELNEINALTHTNLIKQSGRLAIESTCQLVNRGCSAYFDTIQLYKKSLLNLIDLTEYCIQLSNNISEYELVWEKAVEVQSETDDLSSQLKDLKIFLDCAFLAYENASLAAFIGGAEYASISAQQMINQVKLQQSLSESEIQTLEVQLKETKALHLKVFKELQEKADAEAKQAEEAEAVQSEKK